METKADLINWLGKSHCKLSYLEISTPGTGHLYDAVDETVFPRKDCLNYTVPELVNLRNRDHAGAISSYEDGIARLGTARFDVVLVDPWHSYEQSARDLETGLGFVAPGGILVVHDCNPPDASYIGPFHVGLWSGQTYEAFIDFRYARPTMDSFVVDMDLGCALMRPGVRPPAPVVPPEDFDRRRLGDWDYFAQHRSALLDLVPADGLEARLARTASVDFLRFGGHPR